MPHKLYSLYFIMVAHYKEAEGTVPEDSDVGANVVQFDIQNELVATSLGPGYCLAMAKRRGKKT